ncbi:MAG: hypothetical protein Q4G07_00325 [Oscillospiraceae bacterium]|nr:hypothetical protein [Oscillospiraceae bacterium]
MKNKKLFSFLLCLLLMVTLAAGAVQAAVIQPRYATLNRASCGITSSKQIYGSAYATNPNNIVSIIVSTTRNGAAYGFPAPAVGTGGASYTSSNAVPSGTYTVSLHIQVYDPSGKVLLEDTTISNIATV